MWPLLIVAADMAAHFSVGEDAAKPWVAEVRSIDGHHTDDSNYRLTCQVKTKKITVYLT